MVGRCNIGGDMMGRWSCTFHLQLKQLGEAVKHKGIQVADKNLPVPTVARISGSER